MALKLIGRWNLGGAPYDPAMKDAGVLIYRSSAASVRKAIFGISDVALGTVLHPGNLSLPYFGNAEIFENYYYLPYRNTAYGNPPWISAVHTTTGALTEFATGPLNWGSYQMRSHIFSVARKTAQMSLVPLAGWNASSIWGNTPPIAANATAGFAPSGDMTPGMPATVPSIQISSGETVVIFGNRVTTDPTVGYHQAYMYAWNGVGIALTYIPRFSYQYFNKGIAGPTMTPNGNPSRMMIADGKLWFFQNRSDTGNTAWLSQMNLSDFPNAAYAHQVWTQTTVGTAIIGVSIRLLTRTPLWSTRPSCPQVP